MSGNVRLSARQQRAVLALAEGKRVHVAAKRAGVNVRTLHRWRGDPAFVAALQATRDEAFAEALASLRRVTGDAVATCASLMRPALPSDVRLNAARAVLAHALRANDQVEVERRLAALEVRIGGSN